jgi:hypothetical protein
MNNYGRNKLIFNTILNNNYKIRRINNNTIVINTNTTKIKCNYILLLSVLNNSILWADDNPFNDIITKKRIKKIREKIEEKMKIKTEDIKKERIMEIINYLLKIDSNNEWILTNKRENIIEYYIITEIIYY